MAQVLTAPFRPAPPRLTAPDVSVCIANWNCIELLRRCLQSLFNQPQGVTFEVVVADNGSTDGAADMVAAEFPQVVLIRNAENRGFARANNQAAAEAGGRFLLFLNNDTLVPPNTLRQFLDLAEANPTVGMFGPRLRGADGVDQISYRRRPTMGAAAPSHQPAPLDRAVPPGVHRISPCELRSHTSALGRSADGRRGVPLA